MFCYCILGRVYCGYIGRALGIWPLEIVNYIVGVCGAGLVLYVSSPVLWVVSVVPLPMPNDCCVVYVISYVSDIG